MAHQHLPFSWWACSVEDSDIECACAFHNRCRASVGDSIGILLEWASPTPICMVSSRLMDNKAVSGETFEEGAFCRQRNGGEADKKTWLKQGVANEMNPPYLEQLAGFLTLHLTSKRRSHVKFSHSSCSMLWHCIQRVTKKKDELLLASTDHFFWQWWK